jgi:hypothetical protein
MSGASDDVLPTGADPLKHRGSRSGQVEGYWFWGRPSSEQLWLDLQEVTRRIKEDYDPTIPDVRAKAPEPKPGVAA